jgi:cell division protein FtsW
MKIAVPLLVFCVGSLLSLGLVMLYSSGIQPGVDHKSARFLVMQLVWGGLGLVACVMACGIDYRWLKRGAWLLFGGVVVLLVLVMIPGIGMKVNGARRWLPLGIGNFQPSELAKLALIVSLAYYGEKYKKEMPTFIRGLVIPGTIMGPVLFLVFIEPDRGGALLMASVCGAMLLLAGMSFRYLFLGAGLAVAGVLVSLWNDSMRLGRIGGWLNLEEHKQGVSYQAWQAMLAFGSGGWTGLGLGNSRQKLGWLPENHTDFILPVIGEELGLIATLAVVVAFIVLLLCGVYISWNSRDTFGLLLGSGIVFLIGLQALVNIGVVTSVFPNKGLPLPFVSYGGSNLLVMLTCVGILLSIARRAGNPGGEWSEGHQSRDLIAPERA